MKKENTPRTLIRDAVRSMPSGTKLVPGGSAAPDSPPRATGKETMKAFISDGNTAGTAPPAVDEGPPKAFPAYSYSANAAAPVVTASSSASTLHHRQTPGQFNRPSGGAVPVSTPMITPVATPVASRNTQHQLQPANPNHEAPKHGNGMTWFEFYLIFVNILISTGILATVFIIALLALTKEKVGAITAETVKETLYLTLQELRYDAAELASVLAGKASELARRASLLKNSFFNKK